MTTLSFSSIIDITAYVLNFRFTQQGVRMNHFSGFGSFLLAFLIGWWIFRSNFNKHWILKVNEIVNICLDIWSVSENNNEHVTIHKFWIKVVHISCRTFRIGLGINFIYNSFNDMLINEYDIFIQLFPYLLMNVIIIQGYFWKMQRSTCLHTSNLHLHVRFYMTSIVCYFYIYIIYRQWVIQVEK